MTAIILVLIVITILLMGALAWGMCAAACDADEQSEEEQFGDMSRVD